MPSKRVTKSKRRKNGYRRRRRMRRSRAILSGFPQQKLVKMRYIDSNITLDPAAGLYSGHAFRANSVYDPDFTSVGHAPMSYSQWAAIYKKYTVLGAKITVTANASVSATVIPGYIGITLSGDSAPLSNYTSINNILESKLTTGGSTTLISGFVNNSPYPAKITRYFSAKKFFGVKDVQDGASLSADVNSNPAKDAYFSVWCASIDGNNPGSVSLKVMIDYIVLFREPQNLDGS